MPLKRKKMNYLRLTKAELIKLYENEQQRADEQHDIAEQLREELDDIETYEEEMQLFEEAQDIMGRIIDARIKLDLGVMSEAEEINNLMEKLESTLLGDVLC
jgi:Mg2+ and Co2+ transporter CorA